MLLMLSTYDAQFACVIPDMLMVKDINWLTAEAVVVTADVVTAAVVSTTGMEDGVREG